ncbi:MAG: DUF4235 domain-containing protein [Acidimicrobiales bacterium]|nr:DUF4235 domain-containing protein [Acidimicrobiales bacterium]
MSDDSSRTSALAWKAVSTLAGVGGAIATRKITNAAWSAVSSGSAEPPLNPADRRVSWSESLQWAIAAGVGAGIGRLVSQRVASAGWESATGSPPPGVAA